MAKRKSKAQRQNEQYLLVLIIAAIAVLGFVKRLTMVDPLIYMIVFLVIALGIAGATAGYFIKRKRSRRRVHDRITAVTHNQIDAMTGIEFEQFLEQVLKLLGYKIESTKISRDGGADLIAVRGKERTSIQAKRYAKTVGNKAVQEAVAAMKLYRCTSSMVITSNYFSADAKKLAGANGTVLIDRDGLGEWMLELIESGKNIKSSV